MDYILVDINQNLNRIATALEESNKMIKDLSNADEK